MQWLCNAKLRTKFLIMLIVPMAGILWFGGLSVWKERQIFQGMQETKSLVELAVRISAVVHETQVERGLSAGFLGSKGEKFNGELPRQRSDKTDKRINLLLDFWQAFNQTSSGSDMVKNLQDALWELQGLASHRQRVDELSIPIPEALGYYTKTISHLLATVASMTGRMANAEMSALSTAYVNLQLAKERAGLERATLTNVFAKNVFEPGMLRLFGRLMGEQEGHVNVFLALSMPAQAAFFQEKMSGGAVDEVEKLRQIAFEKAGTGGFGVDPGKWFVAMTDKINLMKEVEERIASDLSFQAEVLRTAAMTAFFTYLGLLLAIALVTGALGLFYARHILRLVGGEPTEVVKLMEQVAKGDLTVAFDDEAGTRQGIYGAAALMIENIRSIVHQIHLQTDTLNACVGELLEAKHLLDADANSGGQLVREISSANTEMEERVDLMRNNAVQTDARINTVVAAINQLSHAIGEMATVSQQSSSTAVSMAAAAEEMSANLSGVNNTLGKVSRSVVTVASAVEEMTASIEDVRHRCDAASQESSQVYQLADNSLGVVEKLLSSSQEINKMTEIISRIAEQTKILALNAAIEASGAGAAGKGFAVVANEVKNLARQTGDATLLIATQVEKIQDHTRQVANAMQQVVNRVSFLVTSNHEIAKAVGEQATATTEIAHSMGSVAQAAEDVTRNAQELSTAAGEVARSAEESAHESTVLAHVARDAAQAAEDLTRNSREVQTLSFSTLRAAQSSLEAITVTNQTVHDAVTRMGFIEGTAHHTSMLVNVVHTSADDLMEASQLIQVGEEPFPSGAIKGAHLKWLGTLVNVIRGRVLPTAEEASGGHDCAFGKWYDSDGTKRYSQLQSFKKLGVIHKSVHKTARDTVQQVSDNHLQEAIQNMERFDDVRRELFVILDQFYVETFGTKS